MTSSEKSILANTVYRPDESIVANDLEGEVVMMSIVAGTYFGLDSVGSSVWNLIDGKRTVSEIVDLLCEEYEVSHQECFTQVSGMLSEMADHKVLVKA